MQNLTHNQHTVPRCLLKSFNDKELWEYSKKTKIWCKNPINKISVSQWYYEHPAKNINEIENFLGKIENEWAIKGRDKLLKMCKNDNYKLTYEDKEIFSKFLSTLLFRVPSTLEDSKQSKLSFINMLKDMNADEKTINEFKNIDDKEMNLNFVENHEYLNFIKDFYWIIWKNLDSMHKFFASDTPIMGYNGNEIDNHIKYVCISPDICLMLILKNNNNEFLKLCENSIRLIKYPSIKWINSLTINNAYEFIYVKDKRQKKFIDKYLQIHPYINIINAKRSEILANGKVY